MGFEQPFTIAPLQENQANSEKEIIGDEYEVENDDLDDGKDRPEQINKPLTSEQKTDIKTWSRSWLDTLNNNPKKIVNRGVFDNLDMLKDSLIDQLEEDESTYSRAQLQQAAEIFFEETIGYVKELEHNTSEKEVRKFLDNHHQALHSGSPSASDFLEISKLLTLTAKATQDPLMQGYFGQEMVGSLVYRMRFSSPDVYAHIRNECLKLPTHELLDVLHLIQTVGANAAGSSWSESVGPHLQEDILQAIKKQKNSPIINYAAELANERLEKEENEPSIGMVHQLGSAHYGRLRTASSESIKAEHNELAYTFYPDEQVKGRLYHQVAKDAMALLDHSMLPASVGMLPAHTETTPHSLIRTSVVKNLVETLENTENLSRRLDPASIINRISFDIIVPQNHIDRSDLKSLGKEWNKISPLKTAKEWSDFLKIHTVDMPQIESLTQRKQVELRQKAENQIAQLSDSFAQMVSQTMKEFVKTGGNTIPQSILESANKLESINDDPEQLFNTAIECMKRVDIFVTVGHDFGSASHFADDIVTLRERYQESCENIWDNADEEFGQFHNELRRKNKRMVQPGFNQEEFEEFLNDIKSYTTKLDDELKQTLPVVTFEGYDEIPDNKYLNPFQKEHSDIPLLLRHLHQPALRHKIETDLGIDLREIPLRSQIYFLKFLSSQDTSGFERIRSALRKKPESSSYILQSFLACADDMQTAETILTLSNLLDDHRAQQLFAGYSKIVAKTEDVRRYLQEEFKTSGEATEQDVDEVIQNVLTNAKNLLNNYLRAIVKNPEQKDEIMKNMDSLLENIDAGVVLYGSSFKRYFELKVKEGGRVDFNELKNTNLDIKNATEIDPQERDELLTMFELNRAEYSPEVLSAVKEELEAAFGNPQSKFYILRTQDKLTAFIRFDEKGDGTKYAASLNVRKETHGSSIGTAIMQMTIENEGRNHDLTAVVRKGNPAQAMYERDFGFIVDQTHPSQHYNNTDTIFYDMVRPATIQHTTPLHPEHPQKAA